MGLALFLFHPFQPSSTHTGTDLKSETERWGKNNELFCTKETLLCATEGQGSGMVKRKREDSLGEGVLGTGGFCLQKEQETDSSSLANHQHIQTENPQQEEFQSSLKSC